MMKKYLCIWILLCALKVSSQNIVRVEYFFDTDPGFGNGVSIPLTPDTAIVNLTANIDLTNITSGIHMLYIRSLDDQGNWSLSNRRQITQVPHIVAIEYFFDIDPGFGNGIQIPVIADTAITNLNANIDLSSISNGIHTLYIRSKDNYGNWSVTNKRIITQVPFITDIEYFYDTDPGFGNGISIPITSDTVIANLNANLSLNGLSQGIHNLFIRSRDGYGKWSITNMRTINFCPTGFSYFYQDLDNDGYGTLADSILSCTAPIGYTANFSDCNDNDSTAHQQFPFYLDIDGDNFGSGTTTYLFCTAGPNIAPLGYSSNNADCDDNDNNVYMLIPFFIDADGDGFAASSNTVILCSSVNGAVNPPLGYVYFSIGLDCNDNDWDQRMTFPYYIDADQDGYGIGNIVQVCASNSTIAPPGYSLIDGDCNDNNPFIYPGTLDQLEYFIDADPSVGQAIPISVSFTNADSATASMSINTSSLQPGIHLLATRAHVCKMGWGLFEHAHFMVTIPDITTGTLTNAEYFIDTDPGVGNGIAFSIPLADSIDQLCNFNIPITTAPGIHNIGVRVKDSLGNWGHFYITSINVLPPPVPTYPIVAAEYFIDTDPGIGNAIALSVSTSDTLIQTYSIPVPSNLNDGHHLLGIRVKNSNNEWGLFDNRTFYVNKFDTVSNPIIAAEYFIDTDPGIGNAIALSVSSSDTLIQTYSIPVPSNLNDGHHLLGIRVKNSNNEWGLFDNRTFYVSKFDTVSNPIVAAEYFIDTDPGIGNATAISVVPADTIIQNLAIALSTSLAFGNHTINVRVRTLDSTWSLHESKVFNIEEAPSMLPGSGNAISFDGVNDQVDLGSSFNQQNFTIDMWIKPGATQSIYANIIDNNHAGSVTNWTCQQDGANTNVYGFGTMNTGHYFSLIANQWQHLTLVKSATAIETYINGVLTQSTPYSAGPINYNNNFLRLANWGGGGRNWNGQMDEVRIWDIALTQTQIRERMCSKIVNSDLLYPNLVSYYNFDETGTANAKDGSNHTNTGTLINGATRTTSGAAIGNTSAYAYNGNSSSVSLAHPTRGDQINATIASGSTNGLQVYCVTERPNSSTGIDTLLNNDAYYGVFAVNGISAQINATYNYTGVSNITNEGLLNLYQRNANDNVTWANSNASLNTTNNTLNVSTTSRQEFILGIIQPTYVTLNLKAYLEGYYLGNGVMAPVLYNQGEPNFISQTDTVDIILHNSLPPYAIEYTTKTVLDTGGNSEVILPTSVQGNSYYIALKHRNSFETWSANPITISSITNYDFTTSASQAYGDNQVEVDPGVWAIYCGDINQDENADLLDAAILDASTAIFDFGYFATDINGDANVDLLDAPFLEVNVNNFVFSNHP